MLNYKKNQHKNLKNNDIFILYYYRLVNNLWLTNIWCNSFKLNVKCTWKSNVLCKLCMRNEHEKNNFFCCTIEFHNFPYIFSELTFSNLGLIERIISECWTLTVMHLCWKWLSIEMEPYYHKTFYFNVKQKKV